MLEAGLWQKRAQAELLLTRTRENHLEVRAEIQMMKGNQGKYQRLNADGIARAKTIHRRQGELLYLKRSCRDTAKEEETEIEKLQEEHRRKELIRQVEARQAHLNYLCEKLAG